MFVIKCSTMRLLSDNEPDAEEAAAALAAYIGHNSTVYHDGKLLHEFFADPVKV